MRLWLLVLVGAAAVRIEPLRFGDDGVLHLAVSTEYFANDHDDPAVPFLSLGQRSLCRPFAQDELVNDGMSLTSSSFGGTWGAFLEKGFDEYQNPPRFVSSMPVSPNWARYEGYWEQGQWLVARRGSASMHVAESDGGVRYELAAPVKDLGELGIALSRSSEHYEAMFVLSVLLVRRNAEGFFAHCSDERVHVNTKQGFNAVSVLEADSGEVEAYFHGVPRWFGAGNSSCTRQSGTCHVAFVIAVALRRSKWDERKIVARIQDLSDEHQPHESVELHGVVSGGGMPRDVYFVNVETPSVDAAGLFDGEGCVATTDLSEYGFDLTIGECEAESANCGVGEVGEDGTVGAGGYQQSSLRHTHISVAFQWNSCPEATTMGLAVNMDARFLMYENLNDIKSIVDSGVDYVPQIPHLYPGAHMYGDFRVLVPGLENVTLKFHSVVLRDSKGGKKYTLVNNYSTVDVYQDELHRETCWQGGAPYGTCRLPFADTNAALRTRANGEAFDVIQVVAPQWKEDHTWNMVATALLIHSDTDLDKLPDLAMPNETELESSRSSVVQFSTFFRVRKPETLDAAWGVEYLLASLAVLLGAAAYGLARCGYCGCGCGCGTREREHIHVHPEQWVPTPRNAIRLR